MKRHLAKLVGPLFAVLTACKSGPPPRPIPEAPAPRAPAAPKSPPAPPDPDRAFRKGTQAFEAGQYAEAAEVFGEAFDESKNPLAAYNRGLALERQGRLEDAERAYRDASRLAPDHELSRSGWSRMLRFQGKTREAVSIYEEALRRPGGNEKPELFSGLAVALHADKHNPEAEAAAREALARNKDDAEAHRALASIYLEQNRFRLAELTLASVLKLNPKDPSALNTLGLVFLKQSDRERALAQFKRAAAADATFVPALVNQGALALSFRDYRNAERVLGQAVAVEPFNFEAQLALAYALDGQKGVDAKKAAQAGSAFERVLALRPNLPEALCGAGWAYSGDPQARDKARGLLEQCGSRATLSKQERQALELKLKALSAPAAPPPGPAGAPATPPAPK